jgi:membrane-associated protein
MPHFDLTEIIRAVGYLGIFGIIFAESGLLIGFFLPGDSLLFTAGFLASQNFLNIHLLVIGCFIAAVTGDSVGYYIGHKWGRRLFHKKDSTFFHKDHLMKAELFYEKHGGKTIILARFMPVIRTFAPVVAGIGKMKYSSFLMYNVVGGFLWAVCLPYAGYYLGKSIPDIDKYLLPIIASIIIISVAPALFHAVKTPERRASIKAHVSNHVSRLRKKND